MTVYLNRDVYLEMSELIVNTPSHVYTTIVPPHITAEVVKEIAPALERIANRGGSPAEIHKSLVELLRPLLRTPAELAADACASQPQARTLPTPGLGEAILRRRVQSILEAERAAAEADALRANSDAEEQRRMLDADERTWVWAIVGFGPGPTPPEWTGTTEAEAFARACNWLQGGDGELARLRGTTTLRLHGYRTRPECPDISDAARPVGTNLVACIPL